MMMLCVMSTNVFAQTDNNHQEEKNLPTFGKMVKDHDILATIRGLRSYSKDSYISLPMKSFSDAQFEAEFAKKPSLSQYLTDSLKQCVYSFYRNIGYVEDVSVVKSLMCPAFAINAASDTCIYVGSFSLDVTFNTLRTSENERAKTAIDRVIFPIISKTVNDLSRMGHKYIMMAVGYGKRDFSEKYSSEDGACVICIFSITDLKDFAGLELSTDELLRKSSVYIRDMGEIKKVTL